MGVWNDETVEAVVADGAGGLALVERVELAAGGVIDRVILSAGALGLEGDLEAGAALL